MHTYTHTHTRVRTYVCRSLNADIMLYKLALLFGLFFCLQERNVVRSKKCFPYSFTQTDRQTDGLYGQMQCSTAQMRRKFNCSFSTQKQPEKKRKRKRKHVNYIYVKSLFSLFFKCLSQHYQQPILKTINQPSSLD